MEQEYKGVRTFYAKDRQAWRDWLAAHHASEKAVWLILYKKESGVPSVYYSEAVDEALCFGWIDSKPNKRDANSYYQFFAQRNPKSNWSRVNKEKVARLIEQGLMQPAGEAMIALAKQMGTWDALDDVENTTLPDDLRALFEQNPVAYAHWEHFPRSATRAILEWILNAKKAETRQKRIEQTVALAEKNIKANYGRP
ncbi:MAG: YdeI/OmpD-associated family protein [Saprospiraceae bacterium]|nr:YdeI/OmpD-associated family protein [Saprospiraceae bacterium]MDW8230634.1 YdeI/OmpD-associated family protein [Saprospiraceae bacterium]